MTLKNFENCGYAVGKSRYDFIQWHKLNLNVRADLLPVIEGARHGALVAIYEEGNSDEKSQRELLEYCLKRFNLFYKKQGEALYYICDNEAMLEKLWRRPSYIGEFLGYPKCCIKAFYKGARRVSKSQKYYGAPGVVFCRKLFKVYKRMGCEHPLFYTLHVPCGINCKETLALGAKIQKALNDHDKEAAKYLRGHTMKCMYEFHFYHPPKKSRKK